jgi:simple sugar transport system permease protein
VATTAEPRRRFSPSGLALPQFESPLLNEATRLIAAIVLALCVFGLLLVVAGRNPISAYRDVLTSTLGSRYGFSEVVVKMIPLLLCALAVAVPARVGLVNVGGEGQIYIGAWAAAWAALTFTDLSRPLLLSLMVLFAIAGGAAWAGIAAVLRALGWLNETISTLLLNYVAISWVQYFVFGPWKDPHSANFPESAEFVPAAILPTWHTSRVHLGLLFALAGVAGLYFVLRRTRWGFEMRAIGGNPLAARRNGIPIARYIIIALMVGGAFAGLAGLGETSAIQGRLRPDISPGYGYIGFLISWLAGHNPLTIVVMSFLFAVITAGGDSLQLDQHLPFATVNILMALTLAMVLAQRGSKAVRA